MAGDVRLPRAWTIGRGAVGRAALAPVFASGDGRIPSAGGDRRRFREHGSRGRLRSVGVRGAGQRHHRAAHLHAPREQSGAQRAAQAPQGRNPHETFPVLGAGFRAGATWIEASAFSARELTPADSRWVPHAGSPASFAARLRHVLAESLEAQISAEHLRDQGHGEPDAWQASASLAAWGYLHSWCVDGLLDWAANIPHQGGNSNGALVELAVRDPSLRDIFWGRSELNQREEPETRGGGISSPWLFETLDYERVVTASRSAGLQIGFYGEATYVHIPAALVGGVAPDYPFFSAVTLDIGLHLFGMWMLDGGFQRMDHMAL
jgi:hypothetical protein